MGESYTEKARVSLDIIRSCFAFLDRPAYWLLGIIYQLFFNVASADLFSNGTIMKFYGRVQVILGVFMMFQLAMTILRGIVEPDNFTKEKGAGSLLRRVIISLLLITALMPVNIPNPRNTYEEQLNNNGLLFGTLYTLQYRLLSHNTIGRLVLGTSSKEPTFISSSSNDLESSAKIFASTVLKGFYRINLIPEGKDRVETNTGDPATAAQNRMCDIPDDILDKYTAIDADPQDIIGFINEDCTYKGEKRYMFTYMPVISAVTALVFVFILLSFTIDVAVRAVKLAVLRLIAPIPLISYMNPSGKGDEAFKAWTKALTTTYLDLFIRLAVVYFVIYLIQDMIVHGVVMNQTKGVISGLSIILIWIGLFIFAKQAPKFIKEVLGLKGDAGGKLFGGFGELGATIGMATAIPGAIGSGIASARASKMADETRQSFGEKDIFGRPVNPGSAFNRGKHLLSGIAGGLAGGATGVKAAATAKDHGFNASVEAMRKRNASALARGNDGSTLFGRVGSTVSNVFAGEGRADAIEREISTNKSRIEALKGIDARVKSEMVKSKYTTGDLGIKDSSGKEMRANYKDFMGAYNAAKTEGATTVTFRNTATNRDETITMKQAELQQGFLLKNNEDNYLKRMTGYRSGNAEEDKNYIVDTQNTDEKIDSVLVTRVHNAEVLGGSSDFTRDAKTGVIKKGDNKPITGRSSVKDALDGFEDYNTQLTRQNAINKANDKFSGGKK